MFDDIINGTYDSAKGIPSTYSEAWDNVEQSTDAVPGEREKDKSTDGEDEEKDDPEGGGGGSGDSNNDQEEPPEGEDDNNSSTLAQYGDDFGKMGTYVEKPAIKIDWTQVTQRALERFLKREMTQEMVNEIIENNKVLAQDNGSKFDDYMWEIVKNLFGE